MWAQQEAEAPSSSPLPPAADVQSELFRLQLERVERCLHMLQEQEQRLQDEEQQVGRSRLLFSSVPPLPSSAPASSSSLFSPLLLQLSLLHQHALQQPHRCPSSASASFWPSAPAFTRSSLPSSAESLQHQQRSLRQLQREVLRLEDEMREREERLRAERSRLLHERAVVDLRYNYVPDKKEEKEEQKIEDMLPAAAALSAPPAEEEDAGWLLAWFAELTEHRREREAAQVKRKREQQQQQHDHQPQQQQQQQRVALTMDDVECCHCRLRLSTAPQPPFASLLEFAAAVPLLCDQLVFSTRYRHMLLTLTITRRPLSAVTASAPRFSISSDIHMPALSAAFVTLLTAARHRKQHSSQQGNAALPKSATFLPSSSSFSASPSALTSGSTSSSGLPASRSFSSSPFSFSSAAAAPAPTPAAAPAPLLLPFISSAVWQSMLDYMQPGEQDGRDGEEEERRRREEEEKEERLRERERTWREEIGRLEEEERREREQEEQHRRRAVADLRDDTKDGRAQQAAVTTSGANSSVVLNFTTAPAAGDARPYVVAVNGDMGLTQQQEGATQRTMRQWVADGRIDWFLHVGDAGYADDWQEIAGSSYESVQSSNHEASCSEVTPFLCPDGQQNFTSYRTRYRMPPPAGSTSGVGNMYYSFDYGLVHWVVIDTEGWARIRVPAAFGEQLPWLQADLAKAVENRKTVPWIIVVGHRPYYSSDQSDTQPSSQTAFESLFIRSAVDLVFWGRVRSEAVVQRGNDDDCCRHRSLWISSPAACALSLQVHWYERLRPVWGNGLVAQTCYTHPPAPVYVISSVAGCVEGHQQSPNSLQPYTAFVDKTHWGLGLLTVESAGKLVWRWYASDTQTEIDNFTLTKKMIR